MVGSTPTRFRHINSWRRQLQKSEAAKGGIKGKGPVSRFGFFSSTSDNRSAECEFKAAFNQARAKSNPAVTHDTLPFTVGHLHPRVGPALIIIEWLSRRIGALCMQT